MADVVVPHAMPIVSADEVGSHFGHLVQSDHPARARPDVHQMGVDVEVALEQLGQPRHGPLGIDHGDLHQTALPRLLQEPGHRRAGHPQLVRYGIHGLRLDVIKPSHPQEQFVVAVHCGHPS